MTIYEINDIQSSTKAAENLDFVKLFIRTGSDTQSSSTSTSSDSTAAATTSCSPNDHSARCELPVKSNSGLAIGCGVAVPVVAALIMIIVLSIRRRRLVRKEDEEAKRIDDDDDVMFPEMNLKNPRNGEGNPAGGLGYKKEMDGQSQMSDNTNEPKNRFENENSGMYPYPPHQQNALKSQVSLNSLRENPFSTPGSPYQIPELSSSQVSLNNYDPFDQARYPPSGEIYRMGSPKRGGSEKSVNPYGPLNGSKYRSSKQALNTSNVSLNTQKLTINTFNLGNGSDSGNNNTRNLDETRNEDDYDDQYYPPPPFRRRNSYEESSTLSVVSSHTPTTAFAPQFPAPESANIHGDETDDYPGSPESMSPLPPRKGVQFEGVGDKEEEEENEGTKERNGKLGRSDTKNFERVKSVYKEYFPNEMQSPEHRAQEMFDNVPEQGLEQGYYSQNDMNNGDDVNNNYGYAQNDGYVDQYQNSQNMNFNNPESYTSSPPSSSSFLSSSSPQSSTGTSTTSNTIGTANTTSDKSSQQLQQQFSDKHVVHTHVSKLNLSNLPVPHNISDTFSEIGYKQAPRRTQDSNSNQDLQAPPLPSSASALSSVSTADTANSGLIPVYNPLDNNLMYPENDLKSSNVALPSPAQLRQSVAYMTNLEFKPPKKYNNGSNNNADSLSINGDAYSDGSRSSRPGTPVNGFGGGSKVRPPSELVPDSKSQFEKLRPTMEMR